MFLFLKALSRQEKIFIFCVMMAAFFISCEYGVTRPACCSIFIASYTTALIPYAWLAAVPLIFLVTYLYNRSLPLFGCWKTFVFVQLLVVIINTVAAFTATSLPWFPFLQIIWKDIYILLIFKQLWSLIHTTITTSQAKVLYGVIAGVGGVGSIVGGLLAHRLAVPLGSQNLFFFTLPLYFLLFLCYTVALKMSKMRGDTAAFRQNEETPDKFGFSLIFRSKPLIFLLSIVVLMQLSISLIDFQFNLSLEREFPDTDLRTQYYGKINSIINTITSLFQFFGGLVIVHFLGLKKCHSMIPLFLLANGCLLLFSPAFALVSYAFVSIKSLDYSLFLIVREMLYIPLKVEEKFKAKAIIDVFAYRSARAVGSLTILALQFFSAQLPGILNIVSIAIFSFWFLLVLFLFKKEPASQESQVSVE